MTKTRNMGEECLLSSKGVREGADIKPGRMRVVADKSLSAVPFCKIKPLTPGIVSTTGKICRRDIVKLGIWKRQVVELRL